VFYFFPLPRDGVLALVGVAVRLLADFCGVAFSGEGERSTFLEAEDARRGADPGSFLVALPRFLGVASVSSWLSPWDASAESEVWTAADSGAESRLSTYFLNSETSIYQHFLNFKVTAVN
jgi:hypothetical protein